MRKSGGGLIAYDIAQVSPVHIRLTRKLAAYLNGLDLSKVEVGDVIFLPEPHAVMLIREGWAELSPSRTASPSAPRTRLS